MTKRCPICNRLCNTEGDILAHLARSHPCGAAFRRPGAFAGAWTLLALGVAVLIAVAVMAGR
jgi:hypothetical protein